jgi:flagellar FliL protein
MATDTVSTLSAAGAEKDKKDKKEKKAKGGKKSKKKLLIIVLAVLLLGGGGGYYFLAPKGPQTKPKPVPGAVLKLDPINLNLQSGHFLKVGIALQTTADAPKDIEGSKATDIAITTLSNRTIAELSSGSAREKVKKDLVAAISKAYDGKVMDIYFTDFVMQ